MTQSITIARLSGDFDTALAISFLARPLGSRPVKIFGADERASGRPRHNTYIKLYYYTYCYVRAFQIAPNRGYYTESLPNHT